MIGSIAIPIDIDAVFSYFLSFFLSQMITHNMVMILLWWCKEKNYALENAAIPK